MVLCRPTRWFATIASIGLALASSASPARAQAAGSELDRARALFSEGVELIDAERWAEAAEVFQSALALHDAPTIRYNLGLALGRSGRLVEAYPHLTQVRDDTDAASAMRDDAAVLLQEIAPRIGRLSVALVGDTEGAEVTIDDRVLERSALAGPIEIDPGEHRVALRRDGTELASEAVTIADGESARVTLRGVAAVPTARETAERAMPEPDAPTVPSDSSGDVTGEAWFWVLIVAVILAVGGGVTAGVLLGTGATDPQPLQGNLDPPFLDVRP